MSLASAARWSFSPWVNTTRGLLAAMKGKHPRAELGDLPADVRCKAVIALNVPFVEADRHLVLCELGQ